MAIKVSILVPVYKVPENLLRRCIDSLMRQTLNEIEIILVDDGSPDSCGVICDEYAKKDSRIKVIHKENGGLSAARNTAYFNSIGEYIMFLDGDDFIDLSTCEIAYKYAIEQNVDLVFWDVIGEYSKSSVLVPTMKSESRYFNANECMELQARVLDFNGHIAHVFAKLIKRDLLQKYNIIHKEKLKQGAEGLVFNICLFEYVKSAYYIKQGLNHYIYNETSISHSHNVENYYLILQCFEFIYKFSLKSKNKDALLKNFYNRIIYVIVTTGITGYFNPDNPQSFKEKCEGYREFIDMHLVKLAIKKANMNGISYQRRFIIFCVKHHLFWIINILAIIRRKQMSVR